MAMSLVILAIVLASFALGLRIADIRAEVLDRFRCRTPAGTGGPRRNQPDGWRDTREASLGG